MEPKLRRQFRFFGWVQGVGFRWRAKQAADAAGATGWARNEPDGSVTVELQGTQAQIDYVLRALEEGRFIRIERFEARGIPLEPRERRFTAKYEY